MILMSRNEEIHNLYVQKLRRIGEALGFKTTGKITFASERILGVLDCVWRLEKSREFVKSSEYYISTYGLPIVAFEVIHSESTKLIRGSFLNMAYAKPALAVFVFLKRALEKSRQIEDVEKTEEYIRSACMHACLGGRRAHLRT